MEKNDYNEKMKRRGEARRQRMIAYRDKGWTMEAIGKRFGGITRARVNTILKRGA